MQNSVADNYKILIGKMVKDWLQCYWLYDHIWIYEEKVHEAVIVLESDQRFSYILHTILVVLLSKGYCY